MQRSTSGSRAVSAYPPEIPASRSRVALSCRRPATRPASLSQLGAISGVGARKLEAYGDAFLAVIRQH